MATLATPEHESARAQTVSLIKDQQCPRNDEDGCSADGQRAREVGAGIDGSGCDGMGIASSDDFCVFSIGHNRADITI
jgi:hypothetical protein